MQLTTRERNILILAGTVALVFVMTQVFPALRGIYQQRADSIESVRLDIEREQRLIENTADWRERRVAAESERAALEAQIFSGATVPIIEANIQRALSLYARDSNITVASTRLAERLDSDGWLLVSQEMSFRTDDAANTIAFLEKLEGSVPRLYVSDFSLSRNRNQYTGAITVVGFARSSTPTVTVASRR